MSHDRSFFYQPSNEVLSRRVGDEIVLVHLQTNQIHGLNRTAARFWELLEEGQGRSAIVERLRSEFEVGEEELEAEIDELLGSLRAKGLIVDSRKS